MRLSNLCTPWIKGRRKWGPGPTVRLIRPNVVTTATSVVRTWNTNSIASTTSDNTLATARVIRFCFMRGNLGLWGGHRLIEQVVRPNFVLQVQPENLRVRAQDDELPGVAGPADQRLEIRPLGIDVGGRTVGCELVG